MKAEPTHKLSIAARVIALLTGLVIFALVVIFLVRNPYDAEGITTSSRLVMIGIFLLAWVSMLAAWYEKLVILIVSFVIAFIPGFYLLLTPGIFAFIGVAQVGFLLSAWLVYRSRRS